MTRDGQTDKNASTDLPDFCQAPAVLPGNGISKDNKPLMILPLFQAHAAETDPLPEYATSLLTGIREQARTHFSRARGSHDWDHTLRVHRLCRCIGIAEGADLLVVEAAAYLHDIGRVDQDRTDGKLCHAEKGARLAKAMLSNMPIGIERRENIIHCIGSHRFRRGEPPRTVEAKVLFDADKLDAIGAVGVARAFLFAGELGARLHSPEVDVAQAPAYSVNDTGYREYVVKLSKVRERILTDTGRQLADDRHRFMTDFFNRFLEEYKGER
jgi:uncharacterized protein